jgi:FixJ family two-component response regulator
LPAISAVSEMTVNMHRRQFMRKSSSASTARSQPEPR